MVNKNTEEAIKAFKLVLTQESILRTSKERLKEAEKYIPEIEKEFYKQETKELKDLNEGKDLDKT